jgi:hypothetical protein
MLGVITSSSFFVPQVNLPGSMASFVLPAIPIQAMTTNGGKTRQQLLRVIRLPRGMRGLGQCCADAECTVLGPPCFGQGAPVSPPQQPSGKPWYQNLSLMVAIGVGFALLMGAGRR